MRLKMAFLRWLIIVTCALLATMSCTDHGSDPDDPGQRDFPVYISNVNTGWIFSYHPLSGLIDSIRPGITADRGMVVSADGRVLYVADDDSAAAIVLATGSTSLIWPERVPGGVSVSPDNRKLVLNGRQLRILSVDDYSVLVEDTVVVWSAVFSKDSRTLYGTSEVEGEERLGVYKRSLSYPFKETRKAFPKVSVSSVVPSADEKLWFIYGELNWSTSVFLVYSPAEDSVVFSDMLQPGNGFLAVSPDCKYVFYTNPGTIFPGVEPPYSIMVYDVRTHSAVTEISTVGIYGTDTVETKLPVDRIAVTPDGRWLVGIASDFGEFVVVNARTFEVARREDLGAYNYGLGAITCQLRE